MLGIEPAYLSPDRSRRCDGASVALGPGRVKAQALALAPSCALARDWARVCADHPAAGVAVERFRVAVVARATTFPSHARPLPKLVVSPLTDKT